MIVLYFTATGNNLYVAKRIGGNLYSIPQAIKDENYTFSDDKIGFVFPIYGWAGPAYIENFLRKVKLESNYIFAVMSYGMIDGGAASHIQDIAKQSGITFSYINTIRMVDNYLPRFRMEEQIKNEPKKQIENHLDKIISDINSSKKWIVKDSFIDKFMTGCSLKMGWFRGEGVSKLFTVQDTCNKCATCVRVCPMDNVQVQGGKPEFGGNCISCLACIQNCPQSAIRVKGEKSKARFRNQFVTLKEIIAANE